MALSKIRVAIIDDQPKFIEDLTEYLLLMPDVIICGTATKYKQAGELLVREQPDLVFLDIEMPCKNGFKLLNKVRQQGCTSNVIFYTVYDKYMLEALHEAAFDYIIKPVDIDDVKNAIERFKEQKKEQQLFTSTPFHPKMAIAPETIALPTLKGLCFVDIKSIILFRSVCKNSWEVLFFDTTTLKLGKNTNAEKILNLLYNKQFIQISQSCIVNLIYLDSIEFKSRNCILIPPLNHINLKISRLYLSKVRENYQKL